jgi:hypothetical protein
LTQTGHGEPELPNWDYGMFSRMVSLAHPASVGGRTHPNLAVQNVSAERRASCLLVLLEPTGQLAGPKK